jgi:hypothetical protein
VCIQQTEKKYFANIRLLIVDENQTKSSKITKQQQRDKKKNKKRFCVIAKRKILMQFPSRSLYAPSIVVSKLIIIMQF